MAAPKITTGYTQPGTKLIVKPNISNYKDTKKYQAALNDFYAKSTDPEAVKYRTDELTKKYGSLKDADGKAIFTPTYIKALAEGVEPPASLDKAVTDWATAKMKEATNYDWDNFSGGIGSVAAQNLLSSFVKDPSQVDSALTFKSSGVELTPEQKEANTKALEDKAAKAEKDTAALENYDPNAGTWDPSKNTVDTPFGNMLSGLVSGYKNPYAADYVNPLTAVEKPTLTNIKTPFKNNAIPQDLVNLFNSAGTDYAGGNNPQTKGTSLGSKMLKLYQPSTTDSSGQLAKPGAPDTTSTTLPIVPKPGEPIITDTGKVVDTNIVKPPVKTAAELAAEKFAADNAATIANSTVVGSSKNDTIKGSISADELAAQQAALSPEHIAWLNSEQARTIAFLNANANDPTKVTNVTNAKSYLDSINADIARTQPDKVVTYKPTTPAVTTPAVTTPAVTTPAVTTPAQIDAWHNDRLAKFNADKKAAEDVAKNVRGTSLALSSEPNIASVVPSTFTLGDVNNSVNTNTQPNIASVVPSTFTLGDVNNSVNTNTQPNIASVVPSTFTGLNGIATNAGSVVSPEYMNTNVAGVGAPITSLLSTQQTPALSGNIQAAKDFNSYYANSTDPAIQSQVAQRNAWLSSVGG